MNISGGNWAGPLARVGVVAEGSYHAGVAADMHALARIAAGCLLLFMLCHLIEWAWTRCQRCEAWSNKRKR